MKQIAKYATSAAARLRDGVIVLDGLHLLQEALAHGDKSSFLRIFATTNSGKKSEIDQFLANFQSDQVVTISEKAMTRIAPTKNPQGILAIYQAPTAPTALSPDANTILLLDRIADPGNMGTIIRTAVAFGVSAIFASPGSADIWSPKVLRAAQGAHFGIDIFAQFNLAEIGEIFDGAIYGTMLDSSAQSLYDTDLTGKVGFCLGNEGSGINPQEFAQYGTDKIYIPISPKCESLNVAITTAICLSEKSRQVLRKN